jgi:hypothetical protein
METALPLKIPVKVDSEIGPDWGMLNRQLTLNARRSRLVSIRRQLSRFG